MKNQLYLFPMQTSTPQASPANLSQSQEEKKARKILDTSGRTCLKLLNRKDPLTALSKTLLASSLWHSTLYAMNWKVKATPQGRLLFQLQASTPRIKEKESGSLQSPWPTPTVRGARSRGAIQAMRKKVEEGAITREEAEAMIEGSLTPARMSPWPTPRASAAMAENIDNIKARGKDNGRLEDRVAMWPTPAARDWKGARKAETLKAKGRKANNSLPDAVAAAENSSKFMTINADWVEWLMGYAQGYTDLESHTENRHPGFNEEPDISRVVHKQKDKRNRLKSLGNSIVPQIAYNLGLAIIEDYEQGEPKLSEE